MDDAPLYLPAELVTLGSERPVRMAVDPPEPSAPAPLVASPSPRGSALPCYVAAVSFDWRRNVPLAGVRPPKSDSGT